MLQAVSLVLACFGGLTLLIALSRWLAGRRWASLGHLLLTGILVYAAARLWPLAADLATYQPLQVNQPVAQVFSERTGSRTWRLTLTRLPSGRMQVFEIAGEQWRLDARTLGWRGPAATLGLQPRFRLDRLSTRFVRTGESAEPPPSSYTLVTDTGDDLWARARTGLDWAEHATAGHAYGVWRPLAQGARWEVWYDGKGLQARPANEAAATTHAAG
jgi:hypothetical protein